MQTSKRILKSCVLFLLLFVLVSVLLIEPIIQYGLYYYCDGKFREKTAGQYEMLFIGDSDGLTAFAPSVYYEETGISSYNLSEEKITGQSELYLLQKEIERNPVKEVVLQVGLDTFTRDYSEEHDEGNTVTLMRTQNLFERLKLLVTNVSFDGYLDVYSNMVTHSILCWVRNIRHDTASNFQSSYLGWHKVSSNDITLPKEAAIEHYDTETVDCQFRDDRVEEFGQIVNLCKSRGIHITVIMVPMADAFIWKKSNLDDIHNAISGLCEKYSVPFFDFNLYRSRYQHISDVGSFKDSIHMSEEGAEAFTKLFAEAMYMQSMNQDISSLFYESYAAMKNDSPYMAYLKSGE